MEKMMQLGKNNGVNEMCTAYINKWKMRENTLVK
jgi:hypothetical protein